MRVGDGNQRIKGIVERLALGKRSSKGSYGPINLGCDCLGEIGPIPVTLGFIQLNVTVFVNHGASCRRWAYRKVQ